MKTVPFCFATKVSPVFDATATNRREVFSSKVQSSLILIFPRNLVKNSSVLPVAHSITFSIFKYRNDLKEIQTLDVTDELCPSAIYPEIDKEDIQIVRRLEFRQFYAARDWLQWVCLGDEIDVKDVCKGFHQSVSVFLHEICIGRIRMHGFGMMGFVFLDHIFDTGDRAIVDTTRDDPFIRHQIHIDIQCQAMICHPTADTQCIQSSMHNITVSLEFQLLQFSDPQPKPPSIPQSFAREFPILLPRQ